MKLPPPRPSAAQGLIHRRSCMAEEERQPEQPAAKKPRHSWSAWAWKREHLPNK